MINSQKKSALILVILLAASVLIMVEPAFAQSAPAPSVPEFTLKYADYSYSVPPTYGTDPYTGQNITVTSGYEVVNETVQFTILNQPFNPYYDSSGNQIQLYYHIRYKGHYGNTWSDSNSHQEGNSTIIQDTLIFETQ